MAEGESQTVGLLQVPSVNSSRTNNDGDGFDPHVANSTAVLAAIDTMRNSGLQVPKRTADKSTLRSRLTLDETLPVPFRDAAKFAFLQARAGDQASSDDAYDDAMERYEEAVDIFKALAKGEYGPVRNLQVQADLAELADQCSTRRLQVMAKQEMNGFSLAEQGGPDMWLVEEPRVRFGSSDDADADADDDRLNKDGTYAVTHAEKSASDIHLRQAMGALRQRAPHSIPAYGSPNALFCLTPKAPLRKLCLHISEHSAFENIILFFIFLNCIALAAFDPTVDDDESSARNDFLERVEYVFLAVFTLEAIIKTIAFGFVLDPGSYLRNWWNVLDFVIVVLGWVSVIGEAAGGGSGADIKALRAFRVLRSLRVIQGLPSLQLVLNSILRAMPQLSHVAVLAFAIIILYAIVGVEFFADALHSECYFTATDEPVGDGRPCVDPGASFGHQCEPTVQYCQKNTVGPNDGITTFDNIGLAMLLVFQMLTLEGWTDVWYNVNDALGGHLAWIYFVTLVLLGSFFILNLVLGVISAEFTKEGKRAERQQQYRELHMQEAGEQNFQNYLDWIDVADDEETLEQYFHESFTLIEFVDEPHPHITAEQRFRNKQAKLLMQQYAHPTVASYVISRMGVMVVMSVVFVNTVFLAIDHAGASESLQDVLKIGDIAFVCFFAAEMLLKLWALGPWQYWRSNFNRFDAVVVILSIIEVVLTYGFDFNPIGFSVLRSIRLLRLVKFTPYWDSLNGLVKRLMLNFGSIVSLLGLLQLLIIIFALLGMQIFGGRLEVGDGDTRSPRSNFDDFWNSYITVFQIISGEDWNEVMYTAIGAYGGIPGEAGLVSLYFVALVLIGNYVVLNIFLAIAVDSLEALEDVIASDEQEEEPPTTLKHAANGFETGSNNTSFQANGAVHDQSGDATNDPLGEKPATVSADVDKPRGDTSVSRQVKLNLPDAVQGETSTDDIEETPDWANKVEEPRTTPPPPHKPRRQTNISLSVPLHHAAAGHSFNRSASGRSFGRAGSNQSRTSTAPSGNATNKPLRRQHTLMNNPMAAAAVPELRHHAVEAAFGEEDKPIPDHMSLYAFAPDNWIRGKMHYLTTRKWFDTFILVCILISSALMAAEDPVHPEAQRNKILDGFDYVFTGIFTIEMLMKIIALGFVLHPEAYTRSGWNDLDMIVVITSIISLSVSGGSVETVRVLRILRVLRPLRAITRLQKLKEVVQCLVQSILNIGSILMLTLLFVFLFGVMGVQLFKGTFQFCNECPDGEDCALIPRSQCIGTFNTTNPVTGLPEPEERQWQTYDFNFDNTGAGMLALFATATGENWPSFMFRSIDSRGEDQSPKLDSRPAVALFYIFYIVIVAFAMFNIFIGYVIVTFHNTIEQEYEGCPLDKSERKCVQYVLESRPLRLFRHSNPTMLQQRCYRWAERMETFIMAIIFLNLVTLMMRYRNMPDNYENTLRVFNWIFTIIFTVEAVVKIIGLSVKGYFTDGWNVFDFIIVVGSLIDAALDGQGFNISFLRIFRAARLIKLLKRGDIKRLVWTFFKSFRSIPWVSMLIGLVFFVYAVIGMQVFGRLQLNDGETINKNTNFRTLPQALSLLLRTATGESWPLVMQGCMLDPPLCDPHDPDGSTCGSEFAIVYFVTFVMLVSFLVINLFVAVIVDNFEYLTLDASELSPHHLDDFRQVWARYDPDATGRVSHKALCSILTDLDPPLGVGKSKESTAEKSYQKSALHHVLMRLDTPLGADGTVEYANVMMALTRLRMKIMLSEEHEVVVAEFKEWMVATPERIEDCLREPAKNCGHEDMCTCNYSLRFLYTVLRLQYLFRLNRIKRMELERRLHHKNDVGVMKKGKPPPRAVRPRRKSVASLPT
eukprot:m.246032 g.246032  ORF g.246032 m.246032 type:complete len:1856 (-) comp19058_c0_seq4:42-5609(-)